MTEPRTPDDQPIDRASTPLGDLPAAPSTDAADSPTQAWPSLTEADTSATSPVAPLPAAPSASPYEPAESLPSTRVGTVADGGTFGAKEPSSPGRTRLRWGLALVGVLIVALGSFAIVSLVGGRPSPSIALGYMPATTVSYSEIRLDLPGDQRQKLAAFLQAFPGFQDQSAIEPKIDEVFDRIVKAASKDSQTWTADIKPWFGGQIAIGAGVPDPTASSAMAMAGSEPGLVAVTVVDRAKAIAWLTKTAKGAPFQQSTYGDADLFTVTASGSADATMSGAVAINDKVMLAGPTASVKAAIDSGGKGTFGQNDDVKAALATLERRCRPPGHHADAAVRRRRAPDDREAVARRPRQDPDRRDGPRDAAGLAGHDRPVRQGRDRRRDGRPVMVDRLCQRQPDEPGRRACPGVGRPLPRSPRRRPEPDGASVQVPRPERGQGRVRPARPGPQPARRRRRGVRLVGRQRARRDPGRGRRDRRRPRHPSPATRPRPSACSRP